MNEQANPLPAQGADNKKSMSGCAKVAILLFMGGAFFVCLFVGLILYGSSSGTAKIEEYFQLAGNAPTSELMKTFHASLSKEADMYRLAMFIQSVEKHYGKFQSVEMNGFSFSDKVQNGVRLRDYEGTFVFEKGSIPMAISFVNDELLKFEVSSMDAAKPLIPYLTIPEDLSSYKERAHNFWKVFLSGDGEKAFALMSEPLQKQIGRSGAIAQVKNLQTNGALQNIEFLKLLKDPENQKVHFLFTCTMQKGSAVGHVTFEFHLLNSFLIGYQIPSSMAAQLEEG